MCQWRCQIFQFFPHRSLLYCAQEASCGTNGACNLSFIRLDDRLQVCVGFAWLLMNCHFISARLLRESIIKENPKKFDWIRLEPVNRRKRKPGYRTKGWESIFSPSNFFSISVMRCPVSSMEELGRISETIQFDFFGLREFGENAMFRFAQK